MIITETKLRGVYIIEPRRFEDERGFLAPSFTAKEFAEHGMTTTFVAHNISYSKKRGTLRGMHFQAPPHQQDKLIRCTRGAVFDVAVDLRPDSPSFKQWVGVELTAENRSMVYVPGECGHGFQTLVDDTEIFYMFSRPYQPESERGVRWNDAAFGIEWPEVGPRILIGRDQSYPDFSL